MWDARAYLCVAKTVRLANLEQSENMRVAHFSSVGIANSVCVRIAQVIRMMSMANCQLGLSAQAYDLLIRLPECAFSLSYSFI